MKRFNLLPLLLLAALIFSACGPGKDRARFEGKLENIANAEFYVYSEDGAFEGVDTIRIEDGRFTYERKLTEPTLLTLLYPNYTQTYVVVEPGKTVKMKGDAAKLGEAKISGTEQNEMLTEFREANVSGPASNHKLAAAQFIRTNPQTLAAVAIYRRYFASQKQPDVQLALQLLDVLKQAQPNSRSVMYIENFYRPIFENGVGQVLPDFEAETLDGRKVSRADYQGKQLVLVCLGTWQNESRKFMQDITNKIKQAKGKWECLIVSMDVDRKVLRDRIKSDTLTYPVICDRKAFESPLVQKLGLHYVPSCMLVGSNGKIIQRDVTKAEEARIH